MVKGAGWYVCAVTLVTLSKGAAVVRGSSVGQYRTAVFYEWILFSEMRGSSRCKF
jgi:hypothetical protein